MPAEIAKGTVPAQTVVIGNTIAARNFTYTVNALAPTISVATFAVRTPGGTQLLLADCTVASNVVTRPLVAHTVTAEWPKGRLNWDIEVTISGAQKTWVSGEFVMLATAQ